MEHYIETKPAPVIITIVLQDAESKKYSYAYKEIELKDWTAVNTNASTPEEAMAYSIRSIHNKYGKGAADIIVGKPLNT